MRAHWVALVLVAGLLAACGDGAPADREEGEADDGPTPAADVTASTIISDTDGKMALWDMSSGPHLRGANIWQARVYPDLDGLEFKGPGPVGPPYTQEDFDRLAALGANYVNISHPGLFSETPPFTVDEEIQENLDGLLAMIERADMFAVISFRTGPGRSEFSFYFDEAGDWFDESYLNDTVWEDETAQDAWVEMWRYTAQRYRDNPIVAGYDLMVEPNATDVFFGIYEPEEFYPDQAGTLYDWNTLHPRITAGIREVDPDTPILVGGTGYSAVQWLPYLQPTADPRTVYMVHQYEPQDDYTHQPRDSLVNSYPGEFDANGDGVDEQFDRDWLDDLLSTVDDFAAAHGAPLAVNEFGVVRWVPGAAEYMNDLMDLFEQRGMNHALWSWDSSWESFTEEVNEFSFRFGPDPDHRADVDSSDLIDVIAEYWTLNDVRPSNFASAQAPPAGQTPSETGLADVET